MTALVTSALFLESMITSCPASATQHRENGVHTFNCVHVLGLHAHLCYLLVYKGKLCLICLCTVLQDFPSFTYNYGKIPQSLRAATKHRPLFHLYRIFVILLKTGNESHASETAAILSQSQSHTLKSVSLCLLDEVMPDVFVILG